MSKKLLSLLCMVILLFSLVACEVKFNSDVSKSDAESDVSKAEVESTVSKSEVVSDVSEEEVEDVVAPAGLEELEDKIEDLQKIFDELDKKNENDVSIAESTEDLQKLFEKYGGQSTETTTDVQENAEDVDFSLGSWEGDTYTNKFLGIKYKMPNGWNKLSKEEIAKLINVGAASFGEDSESLKKLAEQTSMYYVITTDPNTGNSIQIMSEKPLTSVTMDYYAKNLKVLLESNGTIDYEVGEPKDIKIDGVAYKQVDATAVYSGITMTQSYYIKQLGNYFVGIIATNVDGNLDATNFISSI